MTAPTWLTRQHLVDKLRASIESQDLAAADAALEEAMADVQSYCRRTFVGTEDNFPAVRGIAARLARDSFVNNMDRASYAGPEGLNFIPRPRILTGDERLILDGWRARAVRVGSIRMGVAPGMTPAPEEVTGWARG